MKQKIIQFLISLVLYYALVVYADYILVVPKQFSLVPFLPPLLGLMFGTIAAFGVAVGDFLISYSEPKFNEMIVAFFSAYVPYKLWHKILIDKTESIFAFNNKNLLKFIYINFITSLAASIFIVLTYGEEQIKYIFENTNLQFQYPIEWIGLRFMNDFDVAIFFGMPIFFILISRGYAFHMPSQELEKPVEKVSHMNRMAFTLLYVFFLILFMMLDVSGIIYNLDQMDTWLQFNGEIITMMALTLSSLMYMLLKYRKSIMTNLMLLAILTVFITASVLGCVSFIAISNIIDQHVDNDLQKMSVIYRERLAHSFNDARMAVNTMHQIAQNRLESYDRLINDTSYRQNYLNLMERNFTSLSENASGIVGFYIQYSSDNENIGFLCTRNPQHWGTKLPKFTHQNENPYKDRYHVPQERYLAKWSEPYLDKIADKYIISYVVPLNEGDKFIGIVGIDIDFNYIIHEIKRMSIYEHGYVRLLDKNGVLLYANQPYNESLANKKGFYKTETYLSNGIWLKIIASAHDVYAGRNDMLIHFVVVMLLVVIIVSLFSIRLAERGIQPLILITNTARKIAEGDLNVNLIYKANNELGILVDSIKEMVSKLEIYVYRDKLTGLRNTTAYARKIEEIRKNITDDDKYAVALFDVNFLKRTNDTYGHEAGNELIIRAASLIERIFENSCVYRIGGDEFVAIVEGSDYDNREFLLNKFDKELIKETFKMNGYEIKVSVAHGIATYRASEEYETIFRRADARMYEHKSAIKAAMGLNINSR